MPPAVDPVDMTVPGAAKQEIELAGLGDRVSMKAGPAAVTGMGSMTELVCPVGGGGSGGPLLSHIGGAIVHVPTMH